jgi:hypothetical protein
MGKIHPRLSKHTEAVRSASHAGNPPLLRLLERNLAATAEPALRDRLTAAIAAIKVTHRDAMRSIPRSDRG